MVETGQAETYPTRADPHCAKEDFSELIIRSGGQTWRVPWPSSDTLAKQSPQLSLHETTPHISPTSTVVHWRDAFWRGCMIGLALGCLCMVLFHQLQPSALAASIGLKDGADSLPGAATTLTTRSVPAGYVSHLELPGATVYVIEQGPFKSKQLAQQAIKGKPTGTTGMVVGSGPYQVWFAAAMTQQAAGKSLHTIQANGITARVVPLPWRTQLVTVPIVVNPSQQAELDRWLAAEVSAIRVLTAAVSGDTAVADAVQAVQNAKATAPSASLWLDKSLPASLPSLRLDVNQALIHLQKNQRDAAQQSVLDAWSQLNDLRAMTSTP